LDDVAGAFLVVCDEHPEAPTMESWKWLPAMAVPVVRYTYTFYDEWRAEFWLPKLTDCPIPGSLHPEALSPSSAEQGNDAQFSRRDQQGSTGQRGEATSFPKLREEGWH
jgi:hypothetical protein